jgi:1-acyl-sn-glycerol-3-phosphate acyltransferase
MRREKRDNSVPAVQPISKKGYRLYKKTGRLVSNMFLLPNRFKAHGLENKIEEGPNIIVANHTGAGKDTAALYRIYNRMVFFCASHYLFDWKDFDKEIKDNYMRILIPNVSLRKLANLLLFPIRRLFTRFSAPRIKAIGCISVFNSKEVLNSDWARRNRELKNLIKSYLLDNRAVILLQANLRQASDFNSYVRKFKHGAAKIALELFREFDGFEVPITPVSIYGAEGLMTIGSTVSLRVGKSMTVKPFLSKSNPVVALTEVLEKRVAEMVKNDIEKYGQRKQKLHKF